MRAVENRDILSRLPSLLLPWYAENRRQLPWRADREPYHIWLSEIMLQQTRVEAVKGYYARFLTALPTVAELADCDDDTLRKLWEGLGYYSRVRNLKKAARQIMDRHGGVFPRTYEAVLALPESLRTAVTLFYYEDCTVAQIAQILNISQGAVKLRLNRGRARLRTILNED